MDTNSLVGATAAQARLLAEQIWVDFRARHCALQLPGVVWDADWEDGAIAHALARLAAAEISNEACHSLLEAYMRGKLETQPPLSEAAASMHKELQVWRLSWIQANAATVVHDFDNCFGWHALSADDPAWSSEEFVRDWMSIARGGCRGEGALARLQLESGPLDSSSELVKSAEELLPQEFKLISVAGSGTEAVLSFYNIANAHLSALHAKPISNASLLFFKGSYVGGALGLQGANCTEAIARHALSSSIVTDEHLIRNAPYSCEALSEWAALVAAYNDQIEDTCEGNDLTKAERECLHDIEARIGMLEAAGEHVGGIVVEYVRSKDVNALRPAFVEELRRLLHSRRLLLFEDGVMVGLRCGAPFLGAVTASVQPDFVAIGKAYGFSGVIANIGSTGTALCKRLTNLNGYLTCRLSCADFLRAITVLRSVRDRGLMLNAQQSGYRLKCHLQEQGLVVRGIGLMLGYDDAAGLLLNVRVCFSRCLPPLTFGESGMEVESVRAVGGAGANRVAERVVVLKLEETRNAMLDLGATQSAIRHAHQQNPFLQVLQAQGAASAFAWA